MWFYKDRKASSSQAWFNWTLTARQGWNAARCNCRWTKLQIKGGNKMMKTITWEVFGRRNEGISGRRINVSSWQWVKPSCVHLWINSLHLASAAKGRRIEKKNKYPQSKGGNVSSQRNIAATESWNLPWALASDFSRAQGHPGGREEEKKLFPMWVPGGKVTTGKGTELPKSPNCPLENFLLNYQFAAPPPFDSTETTVPAQVFLEEKN